MNSDPTPETSSPSSNNMETEPGKPVQGSEQVPPWTAPTLSLNQTGIGSANNQTEQETYPAEALAEANFYKQFPDILKHKRMVLENDSLKQDIEQRKQYADSAYLITRIWIFTVVIFIAIQTILTSLKVGMSDASFIAVITTTTTSMFGFWWLVGRYLFNNRDPAKDRNQAEEKKLPD